jgi:hypothetical protein
MKVFFTGALLFLSQQQPPTPQPTLVGPSEVVQQIAIRLDGPARIGLPIWLHADLRDFLVARYPFSDNPRSFGSNRLELRRDGQTLAPLPPMGVSAGSFLMGIVAGSIAPPSSPQNRLPLHLAFSIDRPGRYSVRWRVISESFGPVTQPGPRERLLAESPWLDFDVVAARPSDQETWLTATLAAPPRDPGVYVGDYLPSLLAAAPDRRVAQAVLDGMYSGEGLIESCALSAFGSFPASVSAPLVLESLHRRGPVVPLGYFVSWHSAWFQDRRVEIVNTAASFLGSSHDAVVEGALRMLGWARAFDWNGETTALRNADNAVEAASTALMTREGPVARALSTYLPSIKSAASRDRLWQQIEQRPAEREQALIALTWIADPADLIRIGELLVQPGNTDPRGTDLASLPPQLVRAYGDAATPYIERALAESPYVWVRTQSAEQLALKGRVEAFRFFLDAITAKRSYQAELVEWLRRTFRLPATYTETELTAFLNDRITEPKPAPSQASPVETAVTQLQSRDPAVRQAAAKDLLALAPLNPQNTVNTGAYLLDRVIRKPEQVTADTWRDAALILGRLRHSVTTQLTLYLEREGATSALIELGEAAVPAVTEVLQLGGPPRRRLAAQVLGAIGSNAARDALSTALTTESDAGVRQAIQTALRRLGQRPPPAEIR